MSDAQLEAGERFTANHPVTNAKGIAEDVLARIDTVLPRAGGPYPLHAPEIGGNAWAYVKDCLDTGWVSSVGAWVDRFEDMLANITGGGGALITDDDLLARRLRHMTTTARVNDGAELVHDMVGYNYRFPNINPALGCAQLETLDEKLTAKRDLSARYRAAFEGAMGVQFLASPPWGESNN
jgi:dTDP-4-amino-4,6-dideoxygalactose transaminase